MSALSLKLASKENVRILVLMSSVASKLSALSTDIEPSVNVHQGTKEAPM